MIERGARGGRAAPRIDLSGAEWKLSFATCLAVVYTASWLAIRGGGEAAPQSAPARPVEPGAQARIAGPSPPAARRDAAPARGPRATRIRTRSS